MIRSFFQSMFTICLGIFLLGAFMTSIYWFLFALGLLFVKPAFSIILLLSIASFWAVIITIGKKLFDKNIHFAQVASLLF